MKKAVLREVEVDICDNCGQESGMGYTCFACGYCSCYACHEKVMVKFSFGVYVSGWADGSYCKPCDIKLSEDKSDPLHNAYVQVRKLRDELKQWDEDFTARHRAAQAEAERLYSARRATAA